MNILSSAQSGALPSFLFHQPACVKPFPHVVEVGDPWGRIGSGIGDEETAALTAVGEYFERRHFYMEVCEEKRGRLSEAMGASESSVFIDAFLQTSAVPKTRSEVDYHKFGLTTAYRTSDFSACYIPTVTLNLTPRKSDSDNQFFPQRDTCGCSFHVSSESAIFGAMKESLERQFLTRFWLTKRCNKKWCAKELEQLLHRRPNSELLKILAKAGQVYALDISDLNFPGKCIVFIYGNDNSTNHVKYCAGMSYASTLIEALEKSIHELWQTYRFMHLFGALKENINTIGDVYLRHFLDANSIDTFNEISDASEKLPVPGLANPVTAAMNVEGLINTLRRMGIEGYLYTKKIRFFENYYTFSKFLSPSLFLHMNNAEHINLNNQYSRPFLNDVLPARQSVMVPFP